MTPTQHATRDRTPRSRVPLVAAVAACTLLGGVAVISADGAKTAQPGSRATPLYVNANNAEFKQVSPGISKANLWGNPDKGPYGAFTKFQPGQRNELHTHTSDIRIVVLRGAYIYQPENGESVRVTSGGFFMVPGGVRHVSSGDSNEGALFYEESSGKFDQLPVTAR